MTKSATITLTEVEELAHRYATAHTQLGSLVLALEQRIRELRRAALAEIRTAAKRTAKSRSELVVAVEASPDLFEKPRTREIHGIKVGFMKARGRLTWDDEEKVIERIRKAFDAEVADSLVRVKESVDRAGVGKLAAKDLAKIGVELVGAGDEVVCKPSNTEVDEIVAALLAGAAD